MLSAFLAEAPPTCWTCQIPAVIEEDTVWRVVDPLGNSCAADHPEANTRFYCSHECRWLDESNPGRYLGDRNWFDRYHGWELSEVVQDLGFVRPDGKTCIGQPHCSDKIPLWTLDDLRRCEVEVTSPNKAAADARGLPWRSTASARVTNAQLADDTLARHGFTGAPAPGGLQGETILHAPR